jgi:hypothetical protein
MEEFNLDSLAVFKLMNSEVIICEIVSEDEVQVTVRFAIRALEIFSDEDSEVRFTPWIPFTDDLIIISRHGILAFAPPSEEMQQMYLNRMAELDTAEAEPQQVVEIPPFRRICHNHFHS